jgi:hypothetical protein
LDPRFDNSNARFWNRYEAGERFLFEQFARAQYLVTQGFELLADDNLTPEEWKKFRAIANQRTGEIADVALAMQGKRNGQSR